MSPKPALGQWGMNEGLPDFLQQGEPARLIPICAASQRERAACSVLLAALRGQKYYRPLGLEVEESDTGTVYPINETIDASVFERWRFDANYRPANLIDWADRYDVEPGTITTSIRADARLTPLAE